MFYRIVLFLAFIALIFSFSVFASSATCTGGDPETFFKNGNCTPDHAIVDSSSIGIIGLKDKTIKIANGLIVVGSVFSIGAIVLGGFFYASSMGSDEKVKKGKDAIKWGIVGLIVMIVSFAVVNSLINFIYQLQP